MDSVQSPPVSAPTMPGFSCPTLVPEVGEGKREVLAPDWSKDTSFQQEGKLGVWECMQGK